MTQVQGNCVSEFADRGMKVSVDLTRDRAAQAENQSKHSPILLSNTKLLNRDQYIGNAVICEAGSVISFLISADNSRCGFEPIIKSQHQSICEGLYWTSDQQYASVTAYVSRFSSGQQLIKLDSWHLFNRQEGYARSSISIVAKEISSFTKQEPNGTLSNIKMGAEVGALELKFLIFKNLAQIAEAAGQVNDPQGASVTFDAVPGATS
jgi:hypothetical protein